MEFKLQLAAFDFRADQGSKLKLEPMPISKEEHHVHNEVLHDRYRLRLAMGLAGCGPESSAGGQACGSRLAICNHHHRTPTTPLRRPVIGSRGQAGGLQPARGEVAQLGPQYGDDPADQESAPRALMKGVKNEYQEETGTLAVRYFSWSIHLDNSSHSRSIA